MKQHLRRIRHWWIGIVLVVLTLVSTSTLVLYARVETNTDKIARNSQSIAAHTVHELAVARRTAFRICQRQMEERAVIILHVGRHLQKQLALFDCTPDLYGKPARRLTADEVRKFLEDVRRLSGVIPPL